jgi:hypothetical protein
MHRARLRLPKAHRHHPFHRRLSQPHRSTLCANMRKKLKRRCLRLLLMVLLLLMLMLPLLDARLWRKALQRPCESLAFRQRPQQ